MVLKGRFASQLLVIAILACALFVYCLSTLKVANAQVEGLADITTNHTTYLPALFIATDIAWPMAGANPQRTSWTPEEVRGKLVPVWYRQFEPYVHPKFQVIAANNTLYISTSAGLYALDSATGAEKWVYPTEMPLGHSPTIEKGVAYVGGFDKFLHAVNAYTGEGLWKFQGGGGFDTSPLVAEGKVMVGNRDGYFYAIYSTGSNAGQLAWKYKTDGAIDYSAAFKDGVVYFASNDGYAYALNVQSGTLKWKSEKLPGAGFFTWWPVVYEDWVVFSGSSNYRTTLSPGPTTQYTILELGDVYPNRAADPRGSLVGPLGTLSGSWIANTPTINASQPNVTQNGATLPVTEYLEQKPWRRTSLVLDLSTGNEYTTDFDQDGMPEYAPILWVGTHSGNRYPPVVGGDGILYQTNNYMSDPYIAGGQISGWQIGTPYLSIVSSDWMAVDEPVGYSAGGDLIYWNHFCTADGGAFDIQIPNRVFAERYQAGIRPATENYDPNREWKYFDHNLNQLIPGYSSLYYSPTGYLPSFGGRNGVYHCATGLNPPIPYHGMVYMNRFNAILAFAPQADQVSSLSMVNTVTATTNGVLTPSPEALRERLIGEIQKMTTAGHLRPGYTGSGIFDFRSSRWCGDRLTDYWHSPGEVHATLIRTLPYLPVDLRAQARDYLIAEFNAFSPTTYTHIGWSDGAAREPFILPPEVSEDLQYYPPQTTVYDFQGWRFDPYAFYALWKYAEEFGGAEILYNDANNKLAPLPSDSYLLEMPHVHNAFIAGYWGYLELERLAGILETAVVRESLDHLLDLRVASFTKDAPEAWFLDLERRYCRSLNVSANFITLVPELAEYLHTHAQDKARQAVAEYEVLAPYWFVSRFDVTFGEGTMRHLYDYHALFQAKALILKEPYAELARYLDVPAVSVGDLFYIDNLVSALDAAGGP